MHVPEQEVEQAAKQTGLEVADLTPLTDSQCMSVGRFKLEFMHTPGHSPGSMCIRVTGEEGEGEGKVDLLIAGDTIFPGSCGRLDLPGSGERVRGCIGAACRCLMASCGVCGPRRPCGTDTGTHGGAAPPRTAPTPHRRLLPPTRLASPRPSQTPG